MFPIHTLKLAERVIGALTKRHMMIVTAESCTGGLIAGALTDIAGSSAVVHGGFVTYAIEAKAVMLDVPEGMLAQFGAVSEQVARSMANGALKVTSGAQISIAVTGVAGPGGGTADKPVGLVHISCSMDSKTHHREYRFGDIGRRAVRLATIDAAFELVLGALSN